MTDSYGRFGAVCVCTAMFFTLDQFHKNVMQMSQKFVLINLPNFTATYLRVSKRRGQGGSKGEGNLYTKMTYNCAYTEYEKELAEF